MLIRDRVWPIGVDADAAAPIQKTSEFTRPRKSFIDQGGRTMTRRTVAAEDREPGHDSIGLQGGTHQSRASCAVLLAICALARSAPAQIICGTPVRSVASTHSASLTCNPFSASVTVSGAGAFHYVDPPGSVSIGGTSYVTTPLRFATDGFLTLDCTGGADVAVTLVGVPHCGWWPSGATSTVSVRGYDTGCSAGAGASDGTGEYRHWPVDSVQLASRRYWPVTPSARVDFGIHASGRAGAYICSWSWSPPGGPSIRAAYDFSFTASLTLTPRSPNPGPIVGVPPTPPPGVQTDCGIGPGCTKLHVIIHGMNDKIDCSNENHWTYKIKDLGCSTEPGTCVLGWDWHEGADAHFTELGLLAGGLALPTGVGTAYRNAWFEGIALADFLTQIIKSGQMSAADICLTGHSFGGVVAGVAAKLLCASGYGSVGELVIIDTPQIWCVLPATNNVDPRCVGKVINVFGEFRDLAFGGPIVGPNVVNVRADLPGWWGLVPDDLLGHNYLVKRIWPAIAGQVRDLSPGSWYEVHNSSTGVSVILPGLPYGGRPCFDFPVDRKDASFDWDMEKLQNWTGHNAQLMDTKGRLAVKLEETQTAGQALADPALLSILPGPNSAQLYRTNTIPHRADYMQFEYVVEVAGDGDELQVSFADTLLYRLPLYSTDTDFVKSDPIYIGDVAGLTDRFVITLLSAGQPGARVYVSNLAFYDVIGVAPDFDNDADVDLADFLHFQDCWTGPNRPLVHPGCEGADFDSDGDADLPDFLEFQRCFNGPNRLPKCLG